MTRILIAIANHGHKNQAFLSQVIDHYQLSSYDCKIVIISNTPKKFSSNVEVYVTPEGEDPWALPFAHRKIFKDHIDQFDYFIYSEDDTLVTHQNISSFIADSEILESNEIAGFVRRETDGQGQPSFCTFHSFFRWLPNSVRKRNGELWANYTNEHAAFFIASRNQLEAAFQSGGFPFEAHHGRHDMLCSAATDIYTTSGFEKLICIDRILDYTIEHLPNKYIGTLGISRTDLEGQIEALHKIYSNELPAYELFDPETKLFQRSHSKNLYDVPDRQLEKLLGGQTKRILFWGGGDGKLEKAVQDLGHDVTVLPFSAVFSLCNSRRGLKVVYDLSKDLSGQFDTVVSVDCLHLVEDVKPVLTNLKELLTPDGSLLVRLPNLSYLRAVRRQFRSKGLTLDDETRNAVNWVSNFRKISKTVHLKETSCHFPVAEKWNNFSTLSLGLLDSHLAEKAYIELKGNAVNNRW